jgi:hypothetical protein
MNDLEIQDEKDQWIDSEEEEEDIASETYSDESDDTDAEVPDMTDPVAAASTITQGSFLVPSLSLPRVCKCTYVCACACVWIFCRESEIVALMI